MNDLLVQKNAEMPHPNPDCIQLIFNSLPERCLIKNQNKILLESEQREYLLKVQDNEVNIHADEICRLCNFIDCEAKLPVTKHYSH
jgi:hypothetical protein